MKRNKVLFFAAIFLSAALALSGCSALRASNQAKDMLEEYFSVYNNGDIDECVDMFGDAIIDDVGDKDTTEVVFYSRRYLLGEVEKSKVTSFDSNGVFGEVQVTLEVEVYYKNVADAVHEEYNFLLSSGDMEIVGIDFGEQKYPIADEMIAEYFTKLDDISKIKKMYIPYVAENLFDDQLVDQQNEYALDAGGEYADYDINDYTYYYVKQDWDDDIYYLAQIDADIEFEDEDFVLYAELSAQDEEVNFNYLEYYPKTAYEVITEYFDYIADKNSSAIINMYSDEFFEYSDFSPADWKGSILDVLLSEYGDFVDYEITSWEFSQVDLTDKTIDVYSFNVVSYYSNGTFDEYITVIRDKGTQAIIGHYISVR